MDSHLKRVSGYHLFQRTFFFLICNAAIEGMIDKGRFLRLLAESHVVDMLETAIEL